jgi:regulator of sirC expression with transglutaminase-like and TPR domain
MNMVSSHLSAPHDGHAMPADTVRSVEAVLRAPEEELDYARAKVALDLLIDPAADADWTFAELDRLTDAARRLAGTHPAEQDKLRAVRTVIYESGAWNGFRPFNYDHEDFRSLRVKLLPNYLTSRRGNCVSMPILFVILADRLGLRVSLAMAQAHLFVRFHSASGRVTNLETTSGANPARDVWLKETVGYTERGVASGFYMRSLPRRQAIAAMASTVLEHLMAERRFREALAVTELILRCHPRDGMAWANQGQACFHIMGAEYLGRFGSELLIPVPLRGGYLSLSQRNHHAFAMAKRLGWEPISSPFQGRA